jgi:hypothetical protein
MTHPTYQTPFSFKISKTGSEAEGTERAMSIIIINRPYRFLEKELRSLFETDETTRVIVDRRNGDRRQKQIPVNAERRKGDNRRSKLEMVEVIMTV